MFHAFKANVDREVVSTRFASELLNVAVVVVADSISCDLWRLAVETSVDINRFDDGDLGLNCLSESEAELYGPNMLTLDLTVHVVWTGALPTASVLRMNSIEPSAGLRLD